MKKKLAAVACIGVALTAYTLAGQIHTTVDRVAISHLSNDEVTTQVAALRKRIIPPEGTPLRDVEAVYGPTQMSDPRKVIKGDRFVHYWLHLLPGTDTNFRAMLIMRVENGKTLSNYINHACVANNRKALGGFGSDGEKKAAEQQNREIQAENRGALSDLREIELRYARQLQQASWNRATRPQDRNSPG